MTGQVPQAHHPDAIAAAVLTPSSDPWNQAVFAAPMLVLYVLSIGLAWAVAPRVPKEGAR